MLDKGLTRKLSCHEMHTGLWDNKETVATFDVPASVAEVSGPLGCAAGLIIYPIFTNKAESWRIQ